MKGFKGKRNSIGNIYMLSADSISNRFYFLSINVCFEKWKCRKKCTFYSSVFQGKIEFVLQNVQVLPFLSYFLNNMINYFKKASKTMKMYMLLMILYPFLDFLDFKIFPVFEAKCSKNGNVLGEKNFCTIIST